MADRIKEKNLPAIIPIVEGSTVKQSYEKLGDDCEDFFELKRNLTINTRKHEG